jgi:hypothetical protein
MQELAVLQANIDGWIDENSPEAFQETLQYKAVGKSGVAVRAGFFKLLCAGIQRPLEAVHGAWFFSDSVRRRSRMTLAPMPAALKPLHANTHAIWQQAP